MPAPTRAARRSKAPTLDAVVAAATELAHAAVQEVAGPGQVGEHVEVVPEDDRVATHYFECRNPAYRGWRWAATLARASRARYATVDEVVLLPSEGALRPPEWLPWSERLRPGDLGVGDLLLTPPDDERLEPGYVPLDPDDEVGAVAWELGLGRPRVLSGFGRELAAERWYEGERGPGAPIAQAAPGRCGTCGFLLRLSGSLRQVFGVCANEYAPDDGQVVSLDHGCGAHSEAALAQLGVGAAQPVVDEVGYDMLGRDEDRATTVARPSVEHPPGSVDGQEPSEDLGHS